VSLQWLSRNRGQTVAPHQKAQWALQYAGGMVASLESGLRGEGEGESVCVCDRAVRPQVLLGDGTFVTRTPTGSFEPLAPLAAKHLADLQRL
jgi:hypothetical protein